MIELKVLKEIEAKAHNAAIVMEWLNEVSENPRPDIKPKDVIYEMMQYHDLCEEIKELIEEN